MLDLEVREPLSYWVKTPELHSSNARMTVLSLSIFIVVRMTVLAAHDACMAVHEVSAYVTTVNNIYTHYKNSPT